VPVSQTVIKPRVLDELERFQPTPGYMRLLKESVLRVWHDRKASIKNEVASAEQRAKTIQQKLDRLDDAFIYQETIDLGTYERQRDRLREELTLVEIYRHGSKLDEFDVEGILKLCGARAPARIGSLDPGVARATAAAPALVFSGGACRRCRRSAASRSAKPSMSARCSGSA
jgi:hypothetical protein